MTTDRPLRGLRRSPPLDLLAILLLTAVVAAILLGGRGGFETIRLVASVLLVTFLPGYAFTAVVFPGEKTETDRNGATADTTSSRGISWSRRYAVSTMSSLVLVPITVFALDALGYGFSWYRTTVALIGVAGILTLAATAVRVNLPPEERLSLPLDAWCAHVRQTLSFDTRTGAVLNAVLLVTALLAAGGVAYSFVGSADDQVTELYLLTEGDDGELVADGFPQEVQANEPVKVVVGVEHYDRRASPSDYTVLVSVQRVRAVGDEVTVVSYRLAERFEPEFGPGGKSHRPVTVSLDAPGERYRVAFLLYRGAPPERPTLENAYRAVHLPINVV